METNKIWALKDELGKYNTHVVNGEICYGGCVKDNPIGIGFYRDLKNIKWALPFYQINSILRVEDDVKDDSRHFKIIFKDSNKPPINILAFNRSGLNTVPIEQITGNGLAKVLTKELVDDNFSYIKVDDEDIAIVVLDLFKLILTKEQKQLLIDMIEDTEDKSIFVCNDKNLTLCCVLNIAHNTFKFERINIGEIAGDKPQKIRISDEIHTNKNIQEYVKEMIKKAKENKERLELIDEIIKLFPDKCFSNGIDLIQIE